MEVMDCVCTEPQQRGPGCDRLLLLHQKLRTKLTLIRSLLNGYKFYSSL